LLFARRRHHFRFVADSTITTQLAKIVHGVKFANGLEVIAKAE
jgi:hypothetical protein